MQGAVQFQRQPIKKLSSRVSEEICELGVSQSNRLFVKDRTTELLFLIDTGADVSILPISFKEKNAPACTESRLFAANNTNIATFGTKSININFGLRREFNWTFLVANVTTPIIGADFLTHYNLVVDLAKKSLIDNVTNLCVMGQIKAADIHSIRVINTDNKFEKILNDFREILTLPENKKITPSSTFHHIETKGRPISAKARRLTPEKLRIAKEEFEQMMAKGICRPSKSNWASPLHMAPKKPNTWRPCGDYRALNAMTEKDRYPIPNIQTFHQRLANKTVFSTVDCDKAYFQVPVAPEDIPKTAIITPFGLFEFPFMPFGLCNAGQTFQRHMDEILRSLDFVVPYLDDIAIASVNDEEHEEHLRIVFERFKKYQMTINRNKCVFGQRSVKFLGHLVTADGISPLPERVEAITNFEKPKIAKDLRRFLATINFYRRFIKDAASIQDKLQSLIRGNVKNDRREVKWTPETELAFNQFKEKLAAATLLAHPHENAPLTLSVDASDTCIGGVLHQITNGTQQPLGFYSKKLNESQRNWSAYSRELLAIYKGVKHFQDEIDGRICTIYTDHKPLIFAFKQRPEKADPRHLRQLHYISQFTTDIRHVRGEENVVPDFLSRIENINRKSIDYNLLATEQGTDEEVAQILSGKTKIAISLTKIPILNSPKQLYCQVNNGQARPFVPKNSRKTVFEAIHGLSHPGSRATKRMIGERFVWPFMKRDITAWTKQCLRCQTSKVNRHNKTPTAKYKLTESRFEHINVDIVGPLPVSHGYRYIVTMIDRFTRWPEVIPVPDITAATVAQAIIDGWIARFGTPLKITTDQGRQFESEIFHQLNNRLGTRHFHTTAYHPQSNGMIERFHRSLKSMLMCKSNTRWSEELPYILLGFRSSYKEDVRGTAAELLYGKTLRLPAEFFSERPPSNNEAEFIQHFRQTMNKIRPTQTAHHTNEKPFIQRELSDCPRVFVRNDTVRKPLQQPYDGPFEVIQRHDKFFKLSINGKEKFVTVDRLKAAFEEKCDNTETIHTTEPRGTTTPFKTRSGRTVKFPDRLCF